MVTDKSPGTLIRRAGLYCRLGLVIGVVLPLLAACSSGTPLPPTVVPSEPPATATVELPTAAPSATATLVLGPTATVGATRAAPIASPSVEPTPIMSTELPGISREEDLYINPPPPLDLRATVLPNGIRLDWNPPPAVTVPHGYGDRIVAYKVHRRTEGNRLAFLAQTNETNYVDTSAAPGVQYYYSVTDLREHDVESGYPNEVTARLTP